MDRLRDVPDVGDVVNSPAENTATADTVREALELAEELTKCWALLPTDEHKYPWGDLELADRDARLLVAALLAQAEAGADREAMELAILNEVRRGNRLEADRDAAVRERDQAREALRFYADPSTYIEGDEPHPTEFATFITPIDQDEGAVAMARKEHAAAEQAREALRQALDCKGPYNGTVSQRGGDPALCAKCEEVARAALTGEGTA